MTGFNAGVFPIQKRTLSKFNKSLFFQQKKSKSILLNKKGDRIILNTEIEVMIKHPAKKRI
jgi:hypothetical protein